ncbi:TolC family protein [bacterium]|nr:TolC family protein [bacterium]
MIYLKRLAFWLAGWLLAASVQAQSVPSLPDAPALSPDLDTSRPISLEQALQQGLNHHPVSQAALARLRSAYWAYEKAASPPSAQLTLATIPGTNVPGSQPGGNNPSGAGAGFATFSANGRTDTYLQFTQPFLPLGAQSEAERLALAEYEMARAGWRDSRVSLRQQLKDSYYTLLAAQASLTAVRDNLSLAQESYQVAERRLEAGAGPKLDLIDAGVQLSRAQQDQVKAEAGLRQAQAGLASLLGVPASTELVVSGELRPPEHSLQFQALLEQAKTSPRFRASQAALERAEAAVGLAETQAHPNPVFSFVRDLSTHTYQVQLGLQFPLDWGQIGNEVRARQENVEEQRHNLRSTELNLSSTLKVSLEQYWGAVRNAAEFREKILLPSEESTRITQYGFKRGAVAYVRLLTSQQNLTAVRKEYIALLQSAWLALDAVEAAAGIEESN